MYDADRRACLRAIRSTLGVHATRSTMSRVTVWSAAGTGDPRRAGFPPDHAGEPTAQIAGGVRRSVDGKPHRSARVGALAAARVNIASIKVPCKAGPVPGLPDPDDGGPSCRRPEGGPGSAGVPAQRRERTRVARSVDGLLSRSAAPSGKRGTSRLELACAKRRHAGGDTWPNHSSL